MKWVLSCWFATVPLVAQAPEHGFRLRGEKTTRVERTALGGPGILASPGARIELAKGEAWAKHAYWAADVVFHGAHSGTVHLEFFGRDQNRPRLMAKLGLLPGLPTRLVLPLSMLDGQTLFNARRPRQLKGIVTGRRIARADLERVVLRLSKGVDPEARLHIRRVWLTTAEPGPLPPVTVPIVDALGQWTARDWPGKTQDAAQLVARLRRLRGEVGTGAPARPEGRSRYGGFAAVRFAASGFFRTAKRDGRHWLVDPDGCAFFSVGSTCVGPPGSGYVEGMADLFTWLPNTDDQRYAACNWHRQGARHFSFGTANLIRAFGEEWWQGWRDITVGQLRRLGCNTIGNWSDARFIESAKLPWVLPLGGFPSTRTKLFRDFPDVFAAEYAEGAKQFAQQMLRHRDDRYLIGYFLRNEPSWGFGKHNLAMEMLATATPSVTREELVRWLQARHKSVDALAKAWGIELDSWKNLVTRAIPDLPEKGAAYDELWEFSKVMVDRYLRLPCKALREVAPNHLNLGIRYAWVSSELCYVAARELFDVFSLNAYVERPAADSIGKITARTGLPVMIGEFHHGATDRGLPSTGIRGVASQRERGRAYRYYVEQGAALPGLVGVHHFQWNDQPVTGRFDGENYNIGFVDVCLRPHREFVEEVAATHRDLLDVLLGKRPPTKQRAKKVTPTYF